MKGEFCIAAKDGGSPGSMAAWRRRKQIGSISEKDLDAEVFRPVRYERPHHRNQGEPETLLKLEPAGIYSPNAVFFIMRARCGLSGLSCRERCEGGCHRDAALDGIFEVPGTGGNSQVWNSGNGRAACGSRIKG